MSATPIETQRLKIVVQTREEARAQIDQLQPHERAAVSSAWLALLDASAPLNPWVLGFRIVDRFNATAIGQCGFKGPPDAQGMVEIAYGISAEHQGKGYATEAAEALTRYAFEQASVRVVRAHTLPESNASTRVLTKCGFQYMGEVIEHEDGLVWRWERSRPVS